MTCTIGLGVISQTVLRNRSLQTLPAGFIFPDVLSQSVCELDPRFQDSLKKGDVADCYKLWCQYAEKHLKRLWQQTDASAPVTSGRGAVRFDSHAFWPTSKRDSAASFLVRRIWKLICRMKEVQKKHFGYLADKTWIYSRDSLQQLPSVRHAARTYSEVFAVQQPRCYCYCF